MLTYAYALVRAEKKLALRGLAAAMPGGGPVRMLAADPGLWLVASSVPEASYDEASLQARLQDLDWVGPRAVAHQAVVERFLRCRAVLPMQLFTLFHSDERAIEHVQRTKRRVARILGHIERHLEWGLRLAWSEEAAPPAVSVAADPSGAAYLARKRDVLAASRSQAANARSTANNFYRALAREASSARRHAETEQAPRSRVLLDAAFLVRSDRTDAFRTVLRQQARSLAGSGLAASLSGPWPPYNFVR